MGLIYGFDTYRKSLSISVRTLLGFPYNALIGSYYGQLRSRCDIYCIIILTVVWDISWHLWKEAQH